MFGFGTMYLLTKTSDLVTPTPTEVTVLAGNCLQCLLGRMEADTDYELQLLGAEEASWRGRRTGDQAVFHDTRSSGVRLTITVTRDDAHQAKAERSAHSDAPSPLSTDDALAAVERLLDRGRADR